MSDSTQPLSKANGTTNPIPQSVVPATARVGVRVTYRFFAANVTKALLGHKVERTDAARTLANFPYVLGTVEGGTFKALQTKILPIQTTKRLQGRLQHCAADLFVFQELSAEQAKQLAALRVKAQDKKLKPEDRAAASKTLAEEFPGGGWAEVQIVETKERVQAGSTVGLCFGVDVKPKFRKYPLWQVKAGDNDIVVDVFETFGQHALNDKATKALSVDLGSKTSPQPTDFYSAQLSGNIWMRSTHPFTATDVDALPKDAADETMRKALKRIYTAEFDAMPEGWGIEVLAGAAQAGSKPASVKLHWIAAENGNCVSNISGLDVKQEVPRRIHPAAYAAVAQAALQAGVTQVSFTSSWRPMLGSGRHRLGLGLDLKWLHPEGDKRLKLNRTALPKFDTTDKDGDGFIDKQGEGEKLTVEEQKAFNAWQQARASETAAEARRKAAQDYQAAASKALTVAKNKGKPDAIEDAQLAVEAADKNLAAATKAEREAREATPAAKEAWTKSMSKNEPSVVGRYRRYVMQQRCITQVIDPWYVTYDPKNPTSLKPNDRSTAEMTSHDNHMHLSINDPELAS